MLSPFLRTVADVAVHLILVATIGQLERRLGCLADEGMLWRASWRASAGKRVAVCART